MDTREMRVDTGSVIGLVKAATATRLEVSLNLNQAEGYPNSSGARPTCTQRMKKEQETNKLPQMMTSHEVILKRLIPTATGTRTEDGSCEHVTHLNWLDPDCPASPIALPPRSHPTR